MANSYPSLSPLPPRLEHVMRSDGKVETSVGAVGQVECEGRHRKPLLPDRQASILANADDWAPNRRHQDPADFLADPGAPVRVC